MDHRSLSRAGAWLLLVVAATFPGCGGGGGGGGRVHTELSGVVTNTMGRSVAGAQVSAAGRSATSLSNGTFVLEDIPEGYQRVTASAQVSSKVYTGETLVDVAAGQSRTVNIMVSDPSLQGGIHGHVIGPNGSGLARVKVFVAGPVSSTMGLTDGNGDYEVDALEGGYDYTVTASLAGYTNQTLSHISVTAGQLTDASFSLPYGVSQGALPAPTGVQAMAWTISGSITRAPGTGPLDWLKRVYRRKRGLPDNPRTVTGIATGRSGRAVAPIVEVDLYWTYEDLMNLLGYSVNRSTSSSGGYHVAGILRDPLAIGYFDCDAVLTPDTVYYYTVSRLDTVEFPDHGTVGPASDVVSAQPLQEEHATSPAQGAHLSADPVFTWAAVPGAATYQIYVWDRFPALTDVDDPNSAQLVWPADITNPGSSLVQAPATSQAYQGPALQPGHTYYWMVVAADQGSYALSASQVAKFTR